VFRELDRDELDALARVAVPCVGFNTRRAARLISQHYDRALAPTGLRSTQFSLLSAVSLAENGLPVGDGPPTGDGPPAGDRPPVGDGPPSGGVTLSDLAFLLATDRTSLTRALTPLERGDLLISSPGTDRRHRIVRLTDHGRTVLEEATSRWRTAQDALVTRIGPQQWQDLMVELHRVSRIVESLRP
jgi:DNA-binding MarR family transcriptional regulator